MSSTERATTATHPLEPLSAEKVSACTQILRREGISPEDGYAFVTVSLREPSKATVLGYRDGDEVEREAFVVLRGKTDCSTYEAVVSISGAELKSFERVPGVHYAVMPEEIEECERVVAEHPEVQEALKKRGITDMDSVVVDPWGPGHYAEGQERRLLTALFEVRIGGPEDNYYAHPVENLLAVYDVASREVARVQDDGVVPIPEASGNYSPEDVGEVRDDLKPIEITQPEGTSFEVDGHEVRWQKWRFRIGFNPREGLVLHTVGYEDGGRVRPVVYRASVSEMFVPYGDPGSIHTIKNAIDVGQYNMGTLVNSLELGCDCLGEIRYFDAAMADSNGEPYTIKNAVCMHEEDYGVLWKHFEYRTGKTEVRRSRRLVISSFFTVVNYEYGFFWYLYQDGSIELEAKLTGIVSTGAVSPGEKPEYGQLLNNDGLYGPIHQHFMNVRLDMQVDGENNSAYEVNSEAVPPGPDNPMGNAFKAVPTLLKTESEAQRIIDPLSARYWKVVNPSEKNSLDEPVGYKLIPGENVLPFAQPDSGPLRFAGGFATKHLWVTPYEAGELYAAGDYPNQLQSSAGLPEWTQADRSVEDTDLVLWYTFGAHHVVRPEDWPVMPVKYIGFKLEPVGFFDQNPAIDVPPSEKGHENGSHCCHDS